ncbi:hypothetical protein B0H13DRAFT_2565807 [Mycena leptocephala]|nr:hypothetical protein B0H13DRAFT_2565807 [Mycena leptocephala]
MASTTFHCLLFQGFTRQASSEVFSSEEEHAVTYSDNATRDQILNIVNVVWDNGLFTTFGVLPAIITPHSSIYRTDRCLETIRHAKKTPVLFVWMKTSDLLLQFSFPNAVYAVAFFVPGSAPFQCLDLSYVLLRFMDRYIRSGNYNRFNLVSLSYRLGPSGSFGVLLFDKRLRTAYHQARLKSRTSQNEFRRQYDHPITTWPSQSIGLKRPEVVTQLVRSARLLAAL